MIAENISDDEREKSWVVDHSIRKMGGDDDDDDDDEGQRRYRLRVDYGIGVVEEAGRAATGTEKVAIVRVVVVVVVVVVAKQTDAERRISASLRLN